ncbi:hypothetical protein MRB53_022541 [Persea americana]|uniref:Uncharacterized protein n=1 Tax=Persea americana TaxID=3435 RepID=A0ACC2L843_PERAE|nr:hypothetical protein MRB53_022541 [Persea americana]
MVRKNSKEDQYWIHAFNEKIPQPQEIIEFPSVLVNSVTGQMEGSFQTYVRPTYRPLLTDFCKELTGIQQSQVDKGVSLSEALVLHDKWLETWNTREWINLKLPF